MAKFTTFRQMTELKQNMHIVIASRGRTPILTLLAFKNANLFHEHAEIRDSYSFWELLSTYPATSCGIFAAKLDNWEGIFSLTAVVDIDPVRDACPGGRRGSCLLFPNPWAVEGARIVLRTEFFPSLLSSEGTFSGIVDSFVKENFSGGNSPGSQISNVLIGGQYTKLCSSGKELKDPDLPLWRNIQIHRCALRESLAPCALGTRRSP